MLIVFLAITVDSLDVSEARQFVQWWSLWSSNTGGIPVSLWSFNTGGIPVSLYSFNTGEIPLKLLSCGYGFQNHGLSFSSLCTNAFHNWMQSKPFWS